MESATNTGEKDQQHVEYSSSDESIADQASEVYSNHSDVSNTANSSDALSVRSDYSALSSSSSERQMAGEGKFSSNLKRGSNR